MRAKCERCQIELNRPNDKEMKQHSGLCLQRSSPLNSGRSVRKSDDIEYLSMDSISAMEVRVQRKRQEVMLGFKSTYISTSNGVQRFGECQMCKILVEPTSQVEHR